MTTKKFIFDKKLKSIGKKKLFFVRTYGCQSNQLDSDVISGILKEIGYTKTSNIEKANLVILNTCAIRENAELKVFGEIGFLQHLRKKTKDFLFGMCGCMAQEDSVIKKISKNKGIDFVFGTHNINQLPEILQEVYKTKKQVIRILKEPHEQREYALPIDRDSKIKASINVIYGCDKFCTYCIVPYTRGRIFSVDKDEIISEVKKLVKQGYKEVNLLGLNVNSYGIDKNDNYYFKDLLEDVAKTKIKRIRFATSNPWNFTTQIVDVIKKYPNIMPFFHLPIQSGDEEILKAMDRPMKISKYIDLVNYIKKNISDCSISTDIIVGFPNETKEQFENTIKLFNLLKYDNAYTFIYSKRIGTPAALIDDKIPYVEKVERLARLNQLVKKYAKENCEKWVGKTVEVLVEGKSEKNKKMLTGYSPQQKVVNFIGKAKVGDLVNVLITSASNFSLNGKQVK